MADIEQLIAAQSALIDALDSGRVEAIEQATATLRQIVTTLKDAPAAPDQPERAAHAMRLNEAARARTAFLADRNRQKLDRLNMRRGGAPTSTYTAQGLLNAR